MMADLGTVTLSVAAVVFAYVFSLNPVLYLMTVVIVFSGFVPFQRFKRLFGIETRAFLQDLLFYILPAGFVVAWALGLKPIPLMDFAGLAIPLTHAFGRIGCFLGGCCFGRRSKFGIEYPSLVWTDLPALRRFKPHKNPRGRVFPLQLVEVTFDVIMFSILISMLSFSSTLSGFSLPLYLAGYSIFRFCNEFFRGPTTQHYFGPLSGAQWLCLVTLSISVLMLTLVID